MQAVAIYQAKSQLSALIHAAEAGDEVYLTRHGKTVVQLALVKDADAASKSEAQALEAIAKWEAFRDKVKAGPALDWQALRDAGRKY